LTGESGLDKQFTITSSVTSLLSTTTPSGQTAANADITVDGLQFSRATNSINDIISGVTLELTAATSGSANISVNQDKSTAKAKIIDFVDSYNQVKGTLDKLTSHELEGAFAGDSVFRGIGNDLRSLMTNISSAEGSSLKRLADLGISITKTGTFEVNSTRLEETISSSFKDVATLFSANTDNQTNTGVAARGIAGDISKLIEDLSSTNGYITTQTSTLQAGIADYEIELSDLEERMERIEERYTRQFLAMQQIVDEMTNTRESLLNSFENLPFTRKD
jgi:flagellar hook-associated protein 2